MIQKFNQFINESVGAQNSLSTYEKINEPFTAFIEKAQERLNNMLDSLTYLVKQMDKAIGIIMEDFEYAVVGEPDITVASDFSEIEVKIRTNIPNNDEAWRADESPAQDLERRLDEYLSDFKNIRCEIYYKPDEDGNCIISLQSYIVDSDNFGDFTEALCALGQNN